MATLMFTLDGSIMTMNATWSGPPGQLVRALCFHPETKLKLKDDSLVSMKDIPLNSVLKNGSTVYAVMHISNVDKDGKCNESLYKIKGGEKDVDILVSGSHLIYNPDNENFVQVEHLPQAEKTDIECKTFTCLITSNHIISIGKWIFHDWEDNNGSSSKTGVSPRQPQTTFWKKVEPKRVSIRRRFNVEFLSESIHVTKQKIVNFSQKLGIKAQADARNFGSTFF